MIQRALRAGLAAELAALGAITALAAPAGAQDEPSLTDLVEILHERGVLDEEQRAELAAKAAREQSRREWTDRIAIWGDLRARFEAFKYHQDAFARAAGTRLEDRYRGRYRAHLDVSGRVVSRATVYLGLASGGSDPRSAFQTIGDGEDFDRDDIRLDLAYATISPFPDAELPGIEEGLLAVDVGRVRNPFVWDELVSDELVFDNDIRLEGASLRVRGRTGRVALLANTGIYVIDENSSAKDPTLVGGQLGGEVDLFRGVSLGARSSIYHFFALDDEFFARAANNLAEPGGTGGNLVDGLARRNGSIQVIEGSAFLELAMSDLFPVIFYGSYAHNLSARSSLVAPNVSREDDAWVVGVFAGDPELLLRLGFAYYYIEANALPSMFIDSDSVTDGFTNRHGYRVSVERQLFEHVDLILTGYLSDRIQGGPAFVDSASGSDRLRGQADLNFEF